MKLKKSYFFNLLAFLIAYEFLLPTSTLNSPWFKGPHFEPSFFMTRMTIIKGFFLKDLLSIILIISYIGSKIKIKWNKNLKLITFTYTCLFLYGIFIAVITNNSYDIFENIRLAIICLTIILLTTQNNDEIIKWFSLGLILSGSLNLYISWKYNIFGLDYIFFLVNQNGPGPIAALLLLLLPWNYKNRVVVITTRIVLFLIAILSLSKIAYLILFILAMSIFVSNIKKIKFVLLSFILFSITISYGVFDEIIKNKFPNGFELIEGAGGDQVRLDYYSSVFEILLENPLGVSYSGYYYALLKTDIYEEGRMIEESKERANPHSTQLYYISSHGFFGLLLMINFFFLLFLFNINLKFIFIIGSLLIYASTVPYLFVTYFFFLPFTVLNKK